MSIEYFTSSSTVMVSQTDIMYIRAIKIKFTAINCKPNTRMYAQFEKESVDDLCNPENGALGEPLITNAEGELTGYFNIPGFRFKTGTREFTIFDRKNPQDLIAGMVSGSALASFTSTGILQRWQTTITNTAIETIENVITTYVEVSVPNGCATLTDPIAQSFDTYGVVGGCFVYSIDLYFREKDTILPVNVQIREMVNGYPGPTVLGLATVPAEHVKVSLNSSLATPFVFPDLIYLKEDKEYCFVVMANTTNYYMYTAELGEVAFETGKKVFEQTHLGSIFKSQNNSTWTAYQFEDVKFNINICEFDTGVTGVLNFGGSAPTFKIPIESYSTTAGSPHIKLKINHRHGFDLFSKIQVEFDDRGTYNGILGENFSGTWPIVDIIDEYNLIFAIGTNATSSGQILSSGFVQHIYIDDAGFNYDSENPPTLTIVGNGTGATATAEVRDGEIFLVTITNPGTGYTIQPDVIISSSVGSGAKFTASTDTITVVATNITVHEVTPEITAFEPGSTSLTQKMMTMKASYPNSGISNYSDGNIIPFEFDIKNRLNQHTLIASRANESILNGNNYSNNLEFILKSSSKNVSPVIDLNNVKLMFYENRVNNQHDQDVESENVLGKVIEIIVIDGGTGYTSAPEVVITPVYDLVRDASFGSGTTATATIADGKVTDVTIVTQGGSYLESPMITFTGGEGTGASALARISDYNTEISPNFGMSMAKYISKAQKLLNLSHGARVISSIYSTEDTSVDFYMKTSLSSAENSHSSSPWVKMYCSTPRNKSKSYGQLYDYTFELDNLSVFDTYQFKFVMNSRVPFIVPIVNNYRAVIVA